MADFEFVHDFAAKHGKNWKNLVSAEQKTNEIIHLIQSGFAGSPPIFFSDVDLVVFGSLARNECTERSDVDWTLLIDGQTVPDHYDFGHLVRGHLEAMNLQEPGSSGMFGQTTFSHDLINYIGGEDDTNHNTSRRILMLLESDNISLDGSAKEGTAYDRVINGILNEYFRNDSGFKSESGSKAKVPRFLLNDIIRFWRTMCVDFAYKQREQQGKKWALRNIKLRMSRKMIFLKGLLMCMSCYQNEKMSVDEAREHLKKLVRIKPLDLLLKVGRENGAREEDLVNLFSAYDDFLGLLNDSSRRKELTDLEMLKAYENKTFLDAREIANRFQDSVNEMFIIRDSKIKEFTLQYGIF